MIISPDSVEVVEVPVHIPQAEIEFEESLKPLKLEAPRITPREIKDKIESVEYVEHTTKNGKLIRWAVLVLKSGHVVPGDPNIVFSPENDRPTFGRELAYGKAFDKMWEREAYLRAELEHLRSQTLDIDWTTITNDPRVLNKEQA